MASQSNGPAFMGGDIGGASGGRVGGNILMP